MNAYTDPRGSGSRSIGILAMLGLLTIGATFTIAFLWSTPENRNSIFWLSLATVGFAELLLFGYPISLELGGADGGRAPFRGATGVIIGIYSLGVAILAVAALIGFSFNLLVTLHIILFVFVVLTAGGVALTQGKAAAGEEPRLREKQQIENLREQFDLIVHKLAALPPDAGRTLTNSARAIQESFRYVRAVGHPKAAGIDSELSTQLQHLQSKVNQFCEDYKKTSGGTFNTDDIQAELSTVKRLLTNRDAA